MIDNNPEKPDDRALVVKNLSNEVVFKTPTEPVRRKKATHIKVLDEDTYIEELGKIIQRDFFPDLEKLKAQNDYLDAMEANNTTKMAELYAKYSSGTRPPTERLASPATFETPINHPQDTPRPHSVSSKQCGQNDAEINEVKPKQSLDEYLSTHTSEDNMSFEEIINIAEEKLRQKFAVLYGVEDKNDEMMAKMLALPSCGQQELPNGKPKEIDTWTYKNKNYIMYVPDGVQLSKEDKIEMARLKQQITHSNTRLSVNPFDDGQSSVTISQIAKKQAKTLNGRIGVDGNTVTQDSPRVRGYGFVRTPSPSPSTMGTPLMTWGEIEGTPFRLDGGDTPLIRSGTGPAFKIADTPKREQIAMALAEKANERHRGLKQKAMDAAKRQMASPSPRPASSLERLASMSPAARRLASGKLCSYSGTLGLSISYSPSPRHSDNRSSPYTPSCLAETTPNKLHKTTTPLIRRKTPKVISSLGRIDAVVKNNLTDDLLNIPVVATRKRAIDFF